MSLVKVLLVDDEATFVNALAEHLKGCGYDVAVAFDGAQAIRALKEEQPALALVDLKLPGMNGEEFIRQAKQLSPQTQVVVLTAYHDEGLKEAALRQAGAVGYLYKPLKSLLDLERQIEALLRSPPRS